MKQLAHELIYQQYAPMMYGTILHIAKDKNLAETIFIEAFIAMLADKQFNENQADKRCLFVVMYSKVFATKFLQAKSFGR